MSGRTATPGTTDIVWVRIERASQINAMFSFLCADGDLGRRLRLYGNEILCSGDITDISSVTDA